MTKLKAITSKKSIKFFRKVITRELRKLIANVEWNVDGHLQFELLNGGNHYICHICHFDKEYCHTLDRISDESLIVSQFMYGYYRLNKYIKHYQLQEVVDDIILSYNLQINSEREYRKGHAIYNQKELIKWE